MYKKLSAEEKALHSKYFVDEIKKLSATRNQASSLKLPFFHTCKGDSLRSIFFNKKIRPTRCEIFNKELTYLFYGKPAYRVSGCKSSSRDPGRFPVSFVINLESPQIEHVYPFDTGALSNSIFKDIFEDVVNPALFEIGSSLDCLQNFITCFYETDEKYFNCQPVVDQKCFSRFSFELVRTLMLVNEKASTKYDNRAYTAELQITNALDFNGSNIKAILLPEFFMEDPELATFLYNNDIDAISYTIEQSDPIHITPLLHELAKNYMLGENIL